MVGGALAIPRSGVPVGILVNILPPIVRQVQRFRKDDGAPVVDHHKGRNLTRDAPALIIMPDIVGVQTIRNGISLDADAGEQRRLSANCNLLVVFGHCIKGHNLSSPYKEAGQSTRTALQK